MRVNTVSGEATISSFGYPSEKGIYSKRKHLIKMLPLEENYFLLRYPSPFLEGIRYAKQKSKKQKNKNKKKKKKKQNKKKKKKKKKKQKKTESHENISLLNVSTPLDYIYIVCAENFFSLGVTDF